MFKSRISLCLSIFLIIGFFFVALPENVKAQVCDFVVSKVEIPDNGVDFDFVFSGDINDNFGLFNGESVPFQLLIGQQAVLIENIPDGYSLSIDCTPSEELCPDGEELVPCLNIELLPDGTGVSIECLSDFPGSCTFTNTLGGNERPIPTLSEWGLIAMAGLLGFIGIMVIRRRKLAA